MKYYLLTLLFLFLSLAGNAQQMEVTGTVLDDHKEPLIGANVTIKNQPGIGSATDINGKYKIKVSKYSTLIFSYVGYETQEILVKDKNIINVVLKESKQSSLDEVVVTGMGAQKKLTVTGAITNVEVSQLQANPTASLVNSLAGNVAGVMARQTSGQPGKNISEFWIRGISTFGANTSAYVLVDGFPRDINDVNVEDIESFSVLKDASATAIYGDKGANGVVLITTKHGKAGKVYISAKVEGSWNTRTFTPNVIEGNEYAQLINEARITRNQEPIYSAEELNILKRGLDPDLYPNVNWKDVLLKSGAPTYRASVNVSGGGTTARYYVSASFIDEKGMYKTDDALEDDYPTNADYRVLNYRLNTDLNITKTSVLKVGVAGRLSKQNMPGLQNGTNIWRNMLYTSPVQQPIVYSNGYVPSAWGGEWMNPWVASTQTGYADTWQNNIQTNATWEQNFDFITKGLTMTANIGYDISNNNYIARLMLPNVWKAERNRDSQGNLIFTHIDGPQQMHQTSSATGRKKEFVDVWLNYQRTLAKLHHIGGTLKFNADSEERTDNVGTDIKEGISRRHETLAGRATYNFAYKYFIDFNFGYTGSENFAKGHQWGFFPAYSVAWNIAEEKFVKNHVSWLNMFKIRYSYGKVGDDNIGARFPYLYTLGVSNSIYDWGDFGFTNAYQQLYYTQIASRNVTWEEAKKRDLGVDLSLFNDKFVITADYFNEFRSGIYYQRNHLPDMIGLESKPTANIGRVHSTGIDGNFTFRQDIGKVKLTVRGNWTYSKNKILAIDEENNAYPYLMYTGHRVGQIWGLKSLGLFKDWEDIKNSPKQTFGSYMPGDIKYADVNGDGVVNSLDTAPIGATARPNLIYGVGMSVQWKGIDANIHFQGAGKSSFLINGANVYVFNSGDWGTPFTDLVHSNRWISSEISGTKATEDPNASYPRLSYGGNANNYRASDYWIRDGRYLRLKTLEIGYSFPKSMMTKLHLSGVRLFFIGTNLLTFSKFKMWDPELGSSTGTEYPIAKTLTLGLNVNI